MAILQTTEDFRKAIAHLQSVNHFGSVTLQLNIGDTVAECEVLDDDTLTDITPSIPTLESALDAALVTSSTANAETTQAANAKTALQALMSGLHTLSAQDKGYAVYGRIFAARNNATQQTIDGITNKASAVAYITGLAEWQAMTAASKAFFAKELEANAGLTMVLLLVLTG
jgi:hypothetical protein